METRGLVDTAGAAGAAVLVASARPCCEEPDALARARAVPACPLLRRLCPRAKADSWTCYPPANLQGAAEHCCRLSGVRASPVQRYATAPRRPGRGANEVISPQKWGRMLYGAPHTSTRIDTAKAIGGVCLIGTLNAIMLPETNRGLVDGHVLGGCRPMMLGQGTHPGAFFIVEEPLTGHRVLYHTVLERDSWARHMDVWRSMDVVLRSMDVLRNSIKLANKS
eukprot:356694-Chlamydomonas_euryale.AAC.6